MKNVFAALRLAALFVGSVVGAGFATGQEIVLFFDGGSVVNLIVAAAFMGFMCFVFAELGAAGAVRSPKGALALDTLVTVCSFAVYVAMIAAAEEVLAGLFSTVGLSLFIALFSAAVSVKNIGWISRPNVVAVPLMAVIIVLVGHGGGTVGGAFHGVRSLAYGAMNLLFSGALLYKEGAGTARKARVLAGVIGGVVIFVMLLFMHFSVQGSAVQEMPFLAAAEGAGLGVLVPIALLLAIVTTMTSCNYLAADKLLACTGDKCLSLALPLLAGVLLANFGFSAIVNAVYPVVSCLGLVVTAAAIALWIFMQRKSDKRRGSCPRSARAGKLKPERPLRPSKGETPIHGLLQTNSRKPRKKH